MAGTRVSGEAAYQLNELKLGVIAHLMSAHPTISLILFSLLFSFCVSSTPLCSPFRFSPVQVVNPVELAAVARGVVLSRDLGKDLAAWQEASKGGDVKRARKVAKFFVGAAMKASQGRALPTALTTAVEAALAGTLHTAREEEG